MQAVVARAYRLQGCSPTTRFYNLFFQIFYNIDVFYKVIIYTLFISTPVYVAEKMNFPILLALN